jgi:hypothetical protein
MAGKASTAATPAFAELPIKFLRDVGFIIDVFNDIIT